MNQNFSIDQEIWKDIEGFEGKYQVSSMGRVKSLERKCKKWDGYRTVPEKIMKGEINRGYIKVNLSINNTFKHYRVHRLVAQAFLDNPLNLPQVNHKDENPLNNRADNLEFCTAEYNNNYGTRIKRIVKSNSKPVLQFTLDGKLVREWPSTQEAGRNGYIQGHVAACCRGERNKHKGYRWAYKEVG